MTKRQFVSQRRKAWKKFESLVNRLDRRAFSAMSVTEIGQFSKLFREVSNDLAVIRSRGWGDELEKYLNHLVGRGHNSFYRASPGNLSHFVRFLSVGFPKLFRKHLAYFAVAATLFFGPFGISWAVVQANPSLASRVLPIEFFEQAEQSFSSNTEGKEEDEGEAEADRFGFGEDRAAMGGFYVYNNVGIALQCFARGILFGVGTVYTLLFNGVLIGAVFGYVVNSDSSERFLSFVISHGSFELTAIAIAGGAGLMLGDALIHPGQRTRTEALRTQGLEAVQIASGAAVMLLVAAGIEAFWSPSGVPVILKYIVGSGLWIMVFLYLMLAGRGK